MHAQRSSPRHGPGLSDAGQAVVMVIVVSTVVVVLMMAVARFGARVGDAERAQAAADAAALAAVDGCSPRAARLAPGVFWETAVPASRS